MKRILATAYDIDPYKGSESATGWNFVFQIARFNKVIAITRKNNKENIEKYIREFNIDTSNMKFYYFDLPYWMRFWKKGARGSSLYFYLWQMFLPVFIKIKKIDFDIAHNINFHTDTFPTFLWLLGKPLVWGPVNHNEKIPVEYLYSKKDVLKDKIKWMIRQFIWKFDIFILFTKWKSTYILAANSSIPKRLGVPKNKYIIFSQVGGIKNNLPKIEKECFSVLVVGRFLTIKSFDIAVRSFAKFIADVENKDNVILTIVGKGPNEIQLKNIVNELNIERYVNFIDWIDKESLNTIYNESSVFIFPSHEGAGMVVVEALSFGIPVLCFDNVGPGELIDKKCGIKIKYGKYDETVNEYSKALLRLYEDKLYLESLSNGAVEKFNQEYNWSKKGEKLKNMYNRIIL